MDKDTTPTPDLPPGAKYRGAVVEDLQLPPAFCLEKDALLSHALEAAYEREFDQLPILNEKRKPIGYLDVAVMKRKFENKEVKLEDPLVLPLSFSAMASVTLFLLLVARYFPLSLSALSDPARHTTLFPLKSKSHPYTTITPLTPLEQLESFFRTSGTEFALVTDDERRWVLAVVTRSDLETFVTRRG